MPVAIKYTSCTRRCSRIKAPLTFERSLFRHVLILWSSALYCSWSSSFQRLNSDTFRPFSSSAAPSSKNHPCTRVLDIKPSLSPSPPDKCQQDSDVTKVPALWARWSTSREGRLYPATRLVCAGHWGLRTGHTSSLLYINQSWMWTSCNRRPYRQREKDGHINDHDLKIVQGTKVTEEVALTRCYKTPINSEWESSSWFSHLSSAFIEEN